MQESENDQIEKHDDTNEVFNKNTVTYYELT